MKSYSRTRFEIVNNTSVQQVSTNTVSGTVALMMGSYTSPKGTESWELLSPNGGNGLTDFTTRHGGLNFTKHGQPQFTIANLLRNGSYVLAKRMVSDDATLANITIKARVVVVNKVSYVYLYGTSAENIKKFKDAYTAGYAKFDPDALPTHAVVDEKGNLIPDIKADEGDTDVGGYALNDGVAVSDGDPGTTTPDQSTGGTTESGGSESSSKDPSGTESNPSTQQPSGKPSGSEGGSDKGDTPSQGGSSSTGSETSPVDPKPTPDTPKVPTASELYLVVTSISAGYTSKASTDDEVASVNTELAKTITAEKKATIVALSDITLDTTGTPATPKDGKYEVKLGITGITAKDTVIAMHKITDGSWEQIVPTEIGDGTVTIQVSSFSPIAIVKVEDVAKPDAPTEKTDAYIYDIPLFTVTTLGRGSSAITIRLIPEYFASKSSAYMKYSFEVSENNDVLESITCTFNPDAIIDSTLQSIQNKVNNTSAQVQVKLFEDGVLKLTKLLAETATIPVEKIVIDDEGHKTRTTVNEPISYTELINYDYINGYDKRENPINGIITKNIADGISADADNLWKGFKPSDVEAFTLNTAEGIKLVNGSNGTMGDAPIQNTEEYTKMLLGTYGKDTTNNNFDPIIYDPDRYKIDAIFDCAYPIAVKNAIIDMVDFRGDMVFLADLGIGLSDLDSIIETADQITKSKYVAIYHNSFNIIDDFTKKEITVTMPYLLAPKLVNHISTGVGRPFAGIANSITFPEIIEDTVNFLPIVIPGMDQKQKLADASINYISYYDGLPVMEAMWTNDDSYTQLSFLHNVMGIQEIIKIIRTRCPKSRYTFLDGDDLEDYLTDTNAIIKEYKNNFESISMTYMADEKYESNNIFYAVIKVKFRHFVNEEFFKVIAID